MAVNSFKALRGMVDVLPEKTTQFRSLETRFALIAGQYGYQEIRMPLIESTHLFKRTIGEVTDIVEKEMYTFTDLNGDSLTLRPEGTAGCVRACIEHGLLHQAHQRLWYLGPMFRHERPQKGRYRQFSQLGAETYGFSGVGIELELILMVEQLFKDLGLSNDVQLEINTIGDVSDRLAYRSALVDYLRANADQLDEDSKRRLEKNPLRILDSKNEKVQALVKKGPQLFDFLSEASTHHFQSLCQGLDALGLNYTVNPQLVRGLDYYEHTVFEWVTTRLGSQSTVCAGGRYDRLLEQLGGPPMPAVGFAAGIERLILLQELVQETALASTSADVFFIVDSDAALFRAFQLADSVRRQHPLIRVLVNVAMGSFKSQFKKADKSGAKLALILGETELAQGVVGFKSLRERLDQQIVPESELNHTITTFFEEYESCQRI